MTMAPIEIVYPSSAAPSGDLTQQARHMRQSVRAPFADDVIAALDRVSRHLADDPSARQWPQLAALGFWLRRSASMQAKREFDLLTAGRRIVRVPRGLVFHLPPANVDTLFVYSAAISLMCGNVNVVRLPSERNAAVAAIVRAFAAGGEVLAARNLFVCYDRRSDATAALSRACDVRVIWGGAEKIDEVRRLPLGPDATELTFGHRFSGTLLDAAAVAAMSEAELGAVAERLFNDIYLFDQVACASPRVFYWVGSAADAARAAPRLYQRIADVVAARDHALDPSIVVGKLTYCYGRMIDVPVASYADYGHVLSVLALDDVAAIAQAKATTYGGGVLWHVVVESLDALLPHLGRDDQTYTHVGFGRDVLVAFARRANGRGIDRMVPAGRALDFNPVWDGYDLYAELTRCVDILA